MTTIIIDPGHGGTDPGSIGIDIHESAATLLTANELKAYLDKHYQVTTIMTRPDNQTFPSLHDRAQMAIDNNAQCIISIHYNHFDGTAHGYGDYIQELIDSNDPTAPGVGDTGNYPKTQASINLQNAIHASVVPVLQKYGITDRGSIGQDLQVLRDSYYQCPGILLEGLFLDNVADAEFYYRKDWHDDYIQAIAQGLAQALGLQPSSPQTSDFQVLNDGQVIGQFNSLADAEGAITTFYNNGNVGSLTINMVNKKPVTGIQMERVFDFVGKAKGDGDSTRSIWYTGNYTTDQPPTNVPNEVVSGYANVAVQGDGNYLSYSIQNSPVGRQIQFEFDFDLFVIGDTNFIASNVEQLIFHIVPKTGTKYLAKIWNPVSSSYELLLDDSAGSGQAQDLIINAPNISEYISSSGYVRFTLFSYNKTLADATAVEIDFDYTKLTVCYHE